jgi:hypothetical protein
MRSAMLRTAALVAVIFFAGSARAGDGPSGGPASRPDPAAESRVKLDGDLAIIQWDETLVDASAGENQVPFSIITGPYISWLTDSTARITWEVIAEKKILDASPYFVGRKDYPLGNLALRSARLSGLKADTKYRYKLTSSNGKWTYAGPEYSFTTLPSPDSKKLRFAIIGDTQRGWEHPLSQGYGGAMSATVKISKLISDWDPPLVLHMGDVTMQASNTDWEWGRVNWIGVLNNMSFMHSSFLAVST